MREVQGEIVCVRFKVCEMVCMRFKVKWWVQGEMVCVRFKVKWFA